VHAVSARLYTIGYEGRTLAECLDELAKAQVGRVVDVRELPLSRKRGFSKTALEEALAELGIEYIHMKPLGNPKPNRERYRSGDRKQGAAVFRRHLHNGSYGALVELARTLDGAATCLLCFEREHAACHREVIVDSLRDLRLELVVEHL
jgi:uncharacterized protein (DUF488 family)